MASNDEGFQAFLNFLRSGSNDKESQKGENDKKSQKEESPNKISIAPDDPKKTNVDDASDEGYNEFLAFLCCPSTNATNKEQPPLNENKDDDCSSESSITIDLDEYKNTPNPNIGLPSSARPQSNDDDSTEHPTQPNNEDDREYQNFLYFLESSSIIKKEMNKVAQYDPAKDHKEMYKFVNLEIGMLFALLDPDPSGGADISKIWGYLKESTHWVCEPRAGNASVLT
ncbi:hypothetical protein ACHAWX_000935 [Stephanocyclus meneghinianus]